MGFTPYHGDGCGCVDCRMVRLARADARARALSALRERFGFFVEHAGYVVGRRAEGALGLARAEVLLERACALGVASVEWVDDDVVDLSWDEDGSTARGIESGSLVGPCGCVVRVGDAVGSLWGIVLSAPSWRGDDPYTRVVAAELASELVEELRQAVGDAEDAEAWAAYLDSSRVGAVV